MNDFAWKGYPAELTCYEIIVHGGSNPGVPREVMYDPALPEEFYHSGANLVLLDARLYRSILHALESGDYTNLPEPLVAAKLEGKERMIQIGYAKRQFTPQKIEVIRPITPSHQARSVHAVQVASTGQTQNLGSHEIGPKMLVCIGKETGLTHCFAHDKVRQTHSKPQEDRVMRDLGIGLTSKRRTHREILTPEEMADNRSRAQDNARDIAPDMFKLFHYVDEDSIRRRVDPVTGTHEVINSDWNETHPHLIKTPNWARAGLESPNDFEKPASLDAAFRHYLLRAAVEMNGRYWLETNYAEEVNAIQVKRRARKNLALKEMYRRVLVFMYEDRFRSDPAQPTRFRGPVWNEYADRIHVTLVTAAEGKSDQVLNAQIGDPILLDLLGPERAKIVSDVSGLPMDAEGKVMRPYGEFENGISANLFDDMMRMFDVFERGVQFERARKQIAAETPWESVEPAQLDQIAEWVYEAVYAPPGDHTLLRRPLAGYVGDPSMIYKKSPITKIRGNTGNLLNTPVNLAQEDTIELLRQEVDHIQNHYIARNPQTRGTRCKPNWTTFTVLVFPSGKC